MSAASSSSLPPLEDRFSVILSRLDRIESSLRCLEDIKKVLVEIEGNTHPDSDGKSVYRKIGREKVTVGIRASIISVGDIDTVGQQFKCDFYLSACWPEPQLQGRSSTEDIDWNNEWHPRIVFFNALEIEKMQKNHFLFYEEGNPIPFALETYRIKGSFRENLELWDFPLDYQELTITLMSDWTNAMVEFEKDLKKADTIRPETFTADQEWFLCRHVVTEATSTVKTEGSSANDYPLYHIRCHVKRKNGYYLWNIAMIIFLIDILSFCSFSVDISSPSDRLSVTLTLLLTAVAFKFVVSQSLPTISYLTLLDKYVLSGLVFLGFMAIENAVAAVIPHSDAQRLFDKICLYVGVGCFLCIHVVALTFVIIKSRARNQALAKSTKMFRERQQMVNNYAVERQKKLELKPINEEETAQQNQQFLIDILSFCSFSVDISSPSDRLTVTLTLLLTAVAFKFVVSQSLPTISYLTLLDKYVLSGLVFLGFMAIEDAVAAVIPDPDAQRLFDRICLYVGVGCFLCIHVVALTFVIIKSRARNQALAKSTEMFRERQQMVNNYAIERQKKLELKPINEEETTQQNQQVVFVEPSRKN